MRKFDINNTAVVPYLIAEKVTEDRDMQEYLIERAERHYKDDKIWRKQFNKSKDQREFLKMFMEHWLKPRTTLQNRLEQELNVLPTSYDYGCLLNLLAEKTNKKVGDLREGKGSWTYAKWAEIFRTQEYLKLNPNSLFKEQLKKQLL